MSLTIYIVFANFNSIWKILANIESELFVVMGLQFLISKTQQENGMETCSYNDRQTRKRIIIFLSIGCVREVKVRG